MRKRMHLGLLIFCVGTLFACSKDPKNQAEVRFEHSQKDMYELSTQIQLPERPLHLEDFLGFALNRNLDLMGLQMEYDIQQETTTAQKLGMLPGLTLNAEISRRSHEVGSTSKSLISGAQSNNASVSSEKVANRRDLSFAWSMLDFGLSYYRSRQELSRGFILQERYKRLRQNLILDVLQAYWKAIISQKAVKGAESIIKLAKERQKSLKRQIESQTISEIQGLENEERLIEMQIRTQTFRSDLESSKAELASLLGLSPGSNFNIASVELDKLNVPDLDINDLEETALVSRPELYIQDYEKKIAADEVKSTIVSMFPNAQLFGNTVYDRNRFLVTKNWFTMGTRAAYDLLAMPRYVRTKKAAEKRLEMAERGRLSISVGVLAQVHLAHLAYLNAISQHSLSNDLYSVKKRLLEAVKKGEILGQFGGAEILRLEAETLFAKVSAVTAYAEMQIALERVNNSIGKSLFYSHLNINEIEASTLGLLDEGKGKAPEKQEKVQAIPEEAIQEREEEEEEEKAAEAPAGLKEEEDADEIPEELLEEKEKAAVKKKKREELPEPPKIYEGYLRGWIRGYSADEEWEDVEVELGTENADEEYEFYEEEQLEKEEQKHELPEPAKPKKEVEVVYLQTPQLRRGIEEKLRRDVQPKAGNAGRLDRLRTVLEGFIDSIVIREELEEAKPVRTFKPMKREEILAYLSEDDADEWISDEIIDKANRRASLAKMLSPEEILNIIEEDTADIPLEGELLARLIQEKPANDKAARLALRTAYEADRIREFMNRGENQLVEEIKEEPIEEVLEEVLSEPAIEEVKRKPTLVEGLVLGMQEFFKNLRADAQARHKSIQEAKSLAEKKAEEERRMKELESTWRELSPEEIHSMIEEGHADAELSVAQEWDLAGEALRQEINYGLNYSEVLKEREAERLRNEAAVNSEKVAFEESVQEYLLEDESDEKLPESQFYIASAENRAEEHSTAVWNISWVESLEERVEHISLQTFKNPDKANLEDISDLVSEDNADEEINSEQLSQILAEWGKAEGLVQEDNSDEEMQEMER
ncbi:hypothetical protein SCG7109_AV_00050 [Chlamydiales bacterium SCGC AG-110-M15]|nr:hypothetical protein SCG7109_AV_00050 [Chlamydiales bacterium SCGC AG-110-M15]